MNFKNILVCIVIYLSVSAASGQTIPIYDPTSGEPNSENIFGDAYDLERVLELDRSFVFSEEEPDEESFLSVNVIRDLRLTFTTRHDTANASSTALNATRVEVNGIEFVVTPETSSVEEISHEFLISGRMFDIGENIVSFSPIQSDSNLSLIHI